MVIDTIFSVDDSTTTKIDSTINILIIKSLTSTSNITPFHILIIKRRKRYITG